MRDYPIQTWYEAFRAQAVERYHWPDTPVSWNDLQPLLQSGHLQLLITETGFILQRLTDYQTAEWLAAYLPEETPDAFQALIKDSLSARDADLPSYNNRMINWAMTGPAQQQWVRYIAKHGFRLAGQMELCWDLANPLTLPVFDAAQQKQPSSNTGVDMVWLTPEALCLLDESRLSALAGMVKAAFTTAPDARWDLRFQEATLMQVLLSQIHQGHQGRLVGVMMALHPARPDVMTGACWVVETSFNTFNIPLLAVSPANQKRGCGRLLLEKTLLTVMQQSGNLSVQVTTSTEQHHVSRLYRQLGFRENRLYAMAYMIGHKAVNAGD